MTLRIGDRVVFCPYGDKNPEKWRRGVIVAKGYGPPSCAADHVFVRYDKTNRTNATAVRALTLESTADSEQERDDG